MTLDRSDTRPNAHWNSCSRRHKGSGGMRADRAISIPCCNRINTLSSIKHSVNERTRVFGSCSSTWVMASLVQRGSLSNRVGTFTCCQYKQANRIAPWLCSENPYRWRQTHILAAQCKSGHSITKRFLIKTFVRIETHRWMSWWNNANAAARADPVLDSSLQKYIQCSKCHHEESGRRTYKATFESNSSSSLLSCQPQRRSISSRCADFSGTAITKLWNAIIDGPNSTWRLWHGARGTSELDWSHYLTLPAGAERWWWMALGFSAREVRFVDPCVDCYFMCFKRSQMTIKLIRSRCDRFQTDVRMVDAPAHLNWLESSTWL